ncbi:MAG: sulfite oxidase-like oxidoreductase [bacterium]|nr:sulfite oxidase-like oxidoreductase [bacterium]
MAEDTQPIIVSSDTHRTNRLPPGQAWTAVDRQTGRSKFPVLDAAGPPQVDPTPWQLELFGLVEQRVVLDWDAFCELPRAQVQCDIHCVTRWSRQENRFEGPQVRTLLERVQIKPEATHVLIHAADQIAGHGNWTTNLPLEAFCDEDCLLATHHEGEPLSREHGGPCRLVVPKLYFWKSAKWITGIEFLAQDRPGYWEQNGYHMHGDPWTEERFG